MSKITVYGLDNKSMGDVFSTVNRSWGMGDGNTVSFKLSTADAANTWLQLGRMIVIHHDKLPSWCGMIDTPWKALPPVTVTAYSPEYLLNIRALSAPITLKGSTAEIIGKLIGSANGLEDVYLRMGWAEQDPDREEKFDLTPIWAQIKKLLTAAGMEIQFRPVLDGNRLFVAVDVKKKMGEMHDFTLRDGRGGNMQVTDCSVESEIWNQVVGIGDKATNESQLQSAPERDEESIYTYRLRNRVVQFAGVKSKSVLATNAANSLAMSGKPKIKLTVNANDVGDTFYKLRCGNVMQSQVSRAYLPGGKHGWKGAVRIRAMSYNESKNQVAMNLESEL